MVGHKISSSCVRSVKHPIKRLFCTKVEKVEPKIKGTPYKQLTIGVPKEIFKNERRVAVSPAVTATFVKKGFTVNIEENAGAEAKFSNADYEAAGGKIVDKNKVFDCELLLKVRMPETSEIPLFRDSGTLLSFLYPGQNKEIIDLLAKKKMTVFAMDCVPRISRAQVFDALSSMANIAGYKGVIEAANNFGRFFTGNMKFFGFCFILCRCIFICANASDFWVYYFPLFNQVLCL